MQKFLWPLLTVLFTSANAFALSEKTPTKAVSAAKSTHKSSTQKSAKKTIAKPKKKVTNESIAKIAEEYGEELDAEEDEKNAEPEAPKEEPPAVLKADEIEGDRDTNIMDAVGNVELTKGDATVTSEVMSYDKNKGTVKASGNFRAQNLEVGKLKATDAEVKDDMSSGVFHNSTLALNNGSYLTSPQTNKLSREITVLQKPVYSICPNEDIADDIDEAGKKTDLITIKSSRAKIDQEKKTVSITNSVVRIYKMPILYMPYIKFPLPDNKRRSGFLSPSYIKNNRFGIGFKTPYFFDLAPNYDLTVTPLVYVENKQFTIYNEFRHMAKYGDYKLNFEFSNNKITNTTDTVVVKRSDKQYRWLITGDGKFDFNTNSSANYKLNTAGDRNYLRDYNYSFLAYTVSEANYDYTNQRNYFGVKTVRFQELVDITKEKNAPFVLPIINSHIETSKPIFFKEKYALTSNFTSIYREDGMQYRRATVIPEINVPINFHGNLFNFNAKIEGDAYSLENNFKEIPQNNNYDSVKTNYKPEFIASWHLPLIQKLKSNTLMVEPIVTFVSSNFRKNFEKLPNEDSNSSELTVNNLFLGDRISGFDRNEAGERVSYGVKSSMFNKLGQFDLTVGQSYRISNEVQDVAIRGFNDNNKSNIVGQFNYKYRTFFNMNYLFQLNESNYKNDVNSVSAGLAIKKFTLSTDYLLLRKNVSNATEVEQASLRAGLKVTKRLSITATASKDFVIGRVISRGLGVVYDGCCIVVNFGITENNSINLLQKQTSYKINVTVKNL